MRIHFFVTAFFSLLCGLLTAQVLDPYFGINGFVKENIEGYDNGRAVFIQDDNKIISIGSTAAHPLYADDFVAIIRYNYDGSLDSTFGDSGITKLGVFNYSQTFFYDFGFQSDQKMILGGQYSTNRFILRYNIDGSLDTNFINGGLSQILDDGYYKDYYTFEIKDNDQIMILRKFQETYYDEYTYSTMRFTADGYLDSLYSINGSVPIDLDTNYQYTLGNFTLIPNGKMLVNGKRTGQDEWGSEINEFILLQLNEDGSIDSSFASNGIFIGNILALSDMEVHTDGKIVCVGTTGLNPQGTTGAMAICRFNSNGSIDSTFSFDGHTILGIGVYADYANAVSIQNDGKIIVGGSYFNFYGGSVTDCVIARFMQDGSLDQSFGEGGVFKMTLSYGTDRITEMTLQQGNQIVFIGSANYQNFDIITGRVYLEDLYLSPDTIICQGDLAYLTAHSDSLVIAWATIDEPGVLLSYESFLSISPELTTTYFAYTNTDTAYVTVHILQAPSFNLAEDSSLCQGDVYLIDANYANATYLWQDSSSNSTFSATQSGIYYVDISNSCGISRDSISLIFNPLPEINLGEDLYLCEGESYTLDAYLIYATYSWQDSTINSSFNVEEGGEFWVELSLNSCTFRDSIAVYYAMNSASYIEVSACDSFISPSGNYSYFESGVYSDTLSNVANCDSVVTIDLIINYSSITNIIEQACESYTDPNGDIYYLSGVYEVYLQSEFGCDSLVNIDLSITNLDLSVSQVGLSLNSNQGDATYQWLDCNNNYAEIDGANDQDFIVTENGSYAVEIENNGCVDTSVCVIIANVGISENTLFSNVSVYPNPNYGLLTIDLGDLSEVSIKLMSIDGKVIYKKENISGPSYQFEMNAKAGVYILEISSGNTKQNYKVVKR